MRYPIVYVILKRLRAPLILLIMAYAIATAGMSIIPGVDSEGNTVHLTIFQSFYFISYVATTIGFGEIPFEFTDAQRLWVVFCIYLTVISWLVAIGNIISLLQDPALQNVWRKQRFIKQTQQLNRKFFIICGYGETGEMLLRHLSERGYQCVVVDNDPDRINLIDLDSGVFNVPFLLGDVGDVETLRMAGLDNEHCRCVIAITNNDRTNIKVAVAAKMLRSNIKVICRATSKEAIANAKSFDTDHIINPNLLYAETFSRTFRTPTIYQLTLSLLRSTGSDYTPALNPPKGHWIICGYNAFAQEMAKFLEFEGMDYTIISQSPDVTIPHIEGRGTEAVTLRAAGIETAVGIIAATGDDADNFSVIMTARHIKPSLFFIARQNQDSNRLIFQNAEIDSVMESSRLMNWQILPLVTQPKLATFLRLARHQDENWAQDLMQQLQALSETVPATYLLKVNHKKAPALVDYLASGNILRLQDLFAKTAMADKPDKPACVPLMLIRDGGEELLPKLSTPIKSGDVFLLASSEKTRREVIYTVAHEQDFHYMIHGEEKPVSIVMALVKNKLEDIKTKQKQRKKAKLAAQKAAQSSTNKTDKP